MLLKFALITLQCKADLQYGNLAFCSFAVSGRLVSVHCLQKDLIILEEDRRLPFMARLHLLALLLTFCLYLCASVRLIDCNTTQRDVILEALGLVRTLATSAATVVEETPLISASSFTRERAVFHFKFDGFASWRSVHLRYGRIHREVELPLGQGQARVECQDDAPLCAGTPDNPGPVAAVPGPRGRTIIIVKTS